MTNREIVEWVAQAQAGDSMPVDWARIVDALNREIGFREPYNGELLTAWGREASVAARAALHEKLSR